MINNIGKIHGSSINGRSSIKIDSSNVDITGNLITKGKLTFTKPDEEIVSLSSSNGILNRFNNVVNIPATDSDGNDLSANTTYEITTGPVGNINNISFKTGKHHGSMTFMPGTIQTTRSTTKPVAHGQLGGQHYYGSGSLIRSTLRIHCGRYGNRTCMGNDSKVYSSWGHHSHRSDG